MVDAVEQRRRPRMTWSRPSGSASSTGPRWIDRTPSPVPSSPMGAVLLRGVRHDEQPVPEPERAGVRHPRHEVAARVLERREDAQPRLALVRVEPYRAVPGGAARRLTSGVGVRLRAREHRVACPRRDHLPAESQSPPPRPIRARTFARTSDPHRCSSPCQFALPWPRARRPSRPVGPAVPRRAGRRVAVGQPGRRAAAQAGGARDRRRELSPGSGFVSRRALDPHVRQLRTRPQEERRMRIHPGRAALAAVALAELGAAAGALLA
jgi:hypothetical protein